VTIAKPFAMSITAVTVDQFSEFVAETKYDAGSKCYTLLHDNWSETAGRFWRDHSYRVGRGCCPPLQRMDNLPPQPAPRLTVGLGRKIEYWIYPYSASRNFLI
jgi:formylglycine-generating enzyme required for sulfatase activity